MPTEVVEFDQMVSWGGSSLDDGSLVFLTEPHSGEKVVDIALGFLNKTTSRGFLALEAPGSLKKASQEEIDKWWKSVHVPSLKKLVDAALKKSWTVHYVDGEMGKGLDVECNGKACDRYGIDRQKFIADNIARIASRNPVAGLVVYAGKHLDDKALPSIEKLVFEKKIRRI